MAFFKTLYGNEAIKKHLAAAIAENCLSHAYIVEGPVGSGRRTLALLTAAALACEKKTGDMPCMECPHCGRILSMNTPDLRLFDRGDEASIKIETVRRLREDIYLAPTENRYKVYIIAEADTMTVQAQNALLKVLEEPPTETLIFLTVTEKERLLPTIRSRAQLLRMERFSEAALSEYVKALSPEGMRLSVSDPAFFSCVLKAADGAVGAALASMTPEFRESSQSVRACVDGLLSALSAPRLLPLYTAVSACPTKRQELSFVLSQTLLAIRDLMLVKKSEETALLYYQDAETARTAGAALSVVRLFEVYDAISAAIADIEKNVNITPLLASLVGALRGGRKG